jgi:hypothetical protein
MHRSSRSSLPFIAVLLSLAACGAPGDTSSEVSDRAAVDPATATDPGTDVEQARAQAQRDLILGEGAGVLDDAPKADALEIRSPELITPDVTTPWKTLASLPVVATAYGFALAVNDVDSTARLGFMFTDPAYQAQLQSQGVLWVGDGAYFGSSAVALYDFTGTGSSTVWIPYQGRLTPQTYSFSELRYDSGNSFYTTLYPSFGGLISVIENGGKGVWALTPNYVTARAHSVAFDSHVLYALASQQTVGLTLSTTPIASFGNLNDLWVNEATIETASAAATLPEMINAGGTLVGAYIVGGNAKIRATTSPSTVTTAAQFTQIGSCTGAAQVDIAYAGSFLYAACVSSSGVLTVKKANIASLASVSWSAVTTGVSGAVTAIDLAGQGSVISLAVRQSTSVEVFSAVTDTTPSFTMVIPGTFALQPASQGLALAVCDLTGARQLQTFLQ